MARRDKEEGGGREMLIEMRITASFFLVCRERQKGKKGVEMTH